MINIKITRYWIIFSVLFILSVETKAGIKVSTANKYKTISATSCDSLIKANSKNPNFVILDVRTPSVWASDHLSGSINRNYYDADFSSQINTLPKNKIYLLHCQSGGRSGPTLALMRNQNFAEVYEMSGGINTWKAASFSTTAVMAPKIMLASSDPKKKVTMHYGWADTLQFTITNRANDTLRFTSITLPASAEFSSNFDLKKKLKGCEDYTFSVFYKPLQQSKDSLKIGIKSNGGDVTLGIFVNTNTTGVIPVADLLIIDIYPNPSSGYLSFKSSFTAVFQELGLFSLTGKMICRELNYPSTSTLSMAGLPNGVYLLRIISGDRQIVKKIVLNR